MDTILSESAGFNPRPATVMHADLNSCFASIEQQANPRLRGRPVAVAAYTTPGGCILTASREAKKLGIETGMRVGEGRALCPALVVLPPDPWKYRWVNRKLLAILKSYTDDVEVKSIDEMVLELEYSPILERKTMKDIALEIKGRIKREIGGWLTVSVGVSTNRYLAKIGAGLHKPDGYDEINAGNILAILSSLHLEDLTGIKSGYGGRLRMAGINTPLDFYNTPFKILRGAFHSIIGYHWWLRLHGWEADDRNFGRKSFGQSHALYKPFAPDDVRLHQVLCQLVEKMSRRMRRHGSVAGGVHVSCLFSDYSYWNRARKLGHTLYASGDIYGQCLEVLRDAPARPVRLLAVSCFALEDLIYEQGELFRDNSRKLALTRALGTVAERWGEFTVFPARMMEMEHRVLDRIAFGGVKELEEFVFRDG